ncbi:MAG: hypothetical protein R3D63_10505 [Paracoccaceae bacterium]
MARYYLIVDVTSDKLILIDNENREGLHLDMAGLENRAEVLRVFGIDVPSLAGTTLTEVTLNLLKIPPASPEATDISDILLTAKNSPEAPTKQHPCFAIDDDTGKTVFRKGRELFTP